MEFTKLKFSIVDGIARIVLADPAHHNAVDQRWTEEFRAAAVACESAPDLRCVVLSAEGGQFSVGGNLREFVAERARVDSHVRGMTVDFHAAILVLNRLPAPLVAAVNGMAAGGGFSLVCMSDLAIASRSARFNFAYTRSGLTPDGGATYFLPRLIGLQRAFDLLATNPTLTADEAQQLGIIARVVDDADFAVEVEKVVRGLAALPAGAGGRLKQLIRAGIENSLPSQLDLEGRSIATQAKHPDTMATLAAFLAKGRA